MKHVHNVCKNGNCKLHRDVWVFCLILLWWCTTRSPRGLHQNVRIRIPASFQLDFENLNNVFHVSLWEPHNYYRLSSSPLATCSRSNSSPALVPPLGGMDTFLGTFHATKFRSPLDWYGRGTLSLIARWWWLFPQPECSSSQGVSPFDIHPPYTEESFNLILLPSILASNRSGECHTKGRQESALINF